MKDIPHIIDTLARTAPILEQLVASIPEDLLHRRRRDGFWTIAEHVNHLAEVQPMLAGRIRRFIGDASPAFVPYIPAEDEAPLGTPSKDMPTAIADFTTGRDEQITLLTGATSADWQKTATHPEYTNYTLYILARHILMHDHWHMYRMEELWLTRDEYLTLLEG